MLNKKCISPIVATALLLIVAVVSVAGFHNWFNNYSSSMINNVEIQNKNNDNNIIIDTLIGNKLYIKSRNENNISIAKLTINGKNCTINTNLSYGMNTIDINGCMNNLTTSTPEILLATNNKIISKKIYIKDLDINTNDNSQTSIPIVRGSFISIWNTSESGDSANNQIKLPIYNGGLYDFYVNGSTLVGSPVHITSYTENILNFASAGIHEIQINGTIKGFTFNNTGDKAKLYDIKQWGILNVGNLGKYFTGCSNFNSTATDSLDLNGTTNLAMMFALSGFNGNINNWDTSEVTDVNKMFYLTSNFNQPLDNWTTNKVTNMSSMFVMATGFNQSLNNWDTSSVNNMRGMFYFATNFNQPLNNWNTSNVIQMSEMFYGATNFNQNLDKWNTGRVIDMNNMFYDTDNFNGNISSWNTSSVTNMLRMFYQAGKFNQSLNNWNVGNVVDMTRMFNGATNFNQPLDKWNVSNLIDMNYLFTSAHSFNQDLTMWDVDQVIECLDFNSMASSWEASNQMDFAGQGSSCTP